VNTIQGTGEKCKSWAFYEWFLRVLKGQEKRVHGRGVSTAAKQGVGGSKRLKYFAQGGNEIGRTWVVGNWSVGRGNERGNSRKTPGETEKIRTSGTGVLWLLKKCPPHPNGVVAGFGW